LVLALLAVAWGPPAPAEDRSGRVVIDGIAHDVIGIFVDSSKLHYRKAGAKPREVTLSEVDSFLAPYEMRLRTANGDTMTVSRVEYAEAEFRLAAPRLGEFVYPEDEVQSVGNVRYLRVIC
jgi:hypothetical protein